jgi:hypothetical protein
MRKTDGDGLDPMPEIAEDFTTEELQEFLAADQADVKADPAFKERLRHRLWEMLAARAVDADRDPDSR